MEIDMDVLSKDRIIEALIHNTPIAYIILDEEYRIHFLNESFMRLRGLDKESTLGERCYNISNKGIPCNTCAVREALVSGKPELVNRKDIFPDGRFRYLDDYAIPLELNGSSEHSYIMEVMVDRTAVMGARAKRQESLNKILEALVELLESKDRYTARHSRNVHNYASMIAANMGLDEKLIQEISIAGLLHDIGKVEVPYEIINKPSKLDESEYAIIMGHPSTGDEMLDGLSQFASIRHHVRHHHERVDGMGYPDGIAGDELSLGAKILAVADTYDAMTTDRPYRGALTHEEAIAEIHRVAGSQLDQEIVLAFSRLNLNGSENPLGKEAAEGQVHERFLAQGSVSTEDLEEVQKQLHYRSEIDESSVLQAIFDNTPCGYVLFDKNSKPIFASNFFLDYMGISDDELQDHLGAEPLIEQTIKAGKPLNKIIETVIADEPRAYELYSIPVFDDDKTFEYLVWCMIDRTEEIELAKSFDKDFMRAISLVKALVYRRLERNEYAGDIIKLEQRLEEIIRVNDINV